MTEGLLSGLRAHPEVEFLHVNTQVSESLAEKGGRRQLRKSVRGFHQLLHFLSHLISFRPDLVYLPLTNSPSFLGFLRDAAFIIPAKVLRVRVAVRLHGGYYFYAHVGGWRRRFVSSIFSAVDLAMVQGKRLTNAFEELVPSPRVSVIPNGISVQPFDDARQRHTAAPLVKRRKRVLFVGLLCETKGFADVLKAVPHVEGAEFAFVGEWESPQKRIEAEEYIQHHGLSDRVLFLGQLSGAAKYRAFIEADIFVFPSYFVYEGHAVVSVEALSAGLPIVCTNHGALDESVVDGWNGYFIPPRAPLLIAERVNRLLSNDELRSVMGERSRQLYFARFTHEKFLQSWVAAIQRACGQPTVGN